MVRLLPPLCWTGLIAWLGSGYWSGAHTSTWLYPTLRAIFPRASAAQIETIHFFIRKAAHVLEYAVLSGLWRRALGGWRVPLLLCLLLPWTGVLKLHNHAQSSKRRPSAVPLRITHYVSRLTSNT